MPTYDYECEACKAHFEIFHSIQETRRQCPKCGKPKLKRLIGPGSGFIFRGPGFYATDYRSSDYQSKAKAESASKSETKAESKSESSDKKTKKDAAAKKD